MNPVIFVCYTCMDYNKYRKDDSNYNPKQVQFESLTEAFEHLKLDHILYAHVVNEEHK